MSHELVRLKEKILDTPHLVHPATFQTIVSYLNDRNAMENFEPEARMDGEDYGNYTYNEDSGVAVMNISGPLTYRPYMTLCGDGGANYQTIKSDFAELVEMGAHTVVLGIDSGGGEAYQCFATARYMRGLADANNVKIISFVDGMAASAAYGLAVAADEIIVAEGSEVGSIGVLVRLINDSKALEKEGYERTFVSAGKEKIPFAADGSFKPEFLQEIQDKVDSLYAEFAGFVASRRNLSVESVIATEAKTFLPEKAMSLGLIDKVMTVEGFYEYLADLSASQNIPERNKSMHSLANLNVTKLNEETLDMEKIAELEASLAEANSLAQAKAVELAALAKEKAELEASLAKANEQLTTMQGEIASKKVASRKATLLQYFAEDKAEALNVSLAEASDAMFETVAEGYKAQHELVKNSELMTELGGQGEQELTEKTSKSVLEVTRSKLNNK
ncbi:putative protease SohB [compost metagenome]